MKVTILEKQADEEDELIVKCDYLDESLTKLINQFKSGKGKMNFYKDSKIVFVEPEDILYFESVDDKVFAYTGDKVIRIEGSLSTFMNEQEDESFFRCSKSMVINVGRVSALKSLSSNRIDATMESGEHIIISRRYASDFRRLLKGDR